MRGRCDPQDLYFVTLQFNGMPRTLWNVKRSSCTDALSFITHNTHPKAGMDEQDFIFTFVHMHRNSSSAFLQTNSETHRAGLRVRFDIVITDCIAFVFRKNQMMWFTGRLRIVKHRENDYRYGEQ
jgi:hypothetical protein